MNNAFRSLAFEALRRVMAVLAGSLATGKMFEIVTGLMARDDLDGAGKRAEALREFKAFAAAVGGSLADLGGSLVNLLLEFAVSYIKNKMGK